MGYLIALEGEDGERLEDLSDPDLLQTLLPSYEDETFPCLRFLDPEGNTTFNEPQAHQLLSELARLKVAAVTDEQTEFLERVERLVRRCLEEVHTYVKFYGD
jgi:hypothetical protein